MRPGPGVDVVCRAEDLVNRFGPHSFDVALSSCAFEHIRHWRAALSAMKQVCRPEGLMIFIVPSHFPYHAYPYDYWRYRPVDVEALFADCDIERLEEETHPYATVYARVRKPIFFVERDLTHYRLYSVITERPIAALRPYHFLFPTFFRVLWRDVGRPRLSRLWLILRMGVRIRVLDPLRRWLA
jgi:SAM-dependent methyltransferase